MEDDIDRAFRRDREPTDFSASSGAVDERHAARDANADAYTDRGDFKENQTKIGGELTRETDRGDERDLNKIHRETTEQTKSYSHDETELRQRDAHNELKAWGQFIELSEHEIDRAVYLFDLVEPPNRWANGLEATALAALTMAANENMGAEPPKVIRQSAEKVAKDSDELEWYSELVKNYETLRKDLDVDAKAVRNVRKVIRDAKP